MIRQYLLNTNKNVIVAKVKKFRELNKACISNHLLPIRYTEKEPTWRTERGDQKGLMGVYSNYSSTWTIIRTSRNQALKITKNSEKTNRRQLVATRCTQERPKDTVEQPWNLIEINTSNLKNQWQKPTWTSLQNQL